MFTFDESEGDQAGDVLQELDASQEVLKQGWHKKPVAEGIDPNTGETCRAVEVFI